MTTSRGRLVRLVTLVAVVAAACTPGEGSSGEAVRPIDEILASEVAVAPDPSGTVATLTVATEVPVACAVVYGPDDDFGAVAVDQDMDGGAHREHAPVLTGLEPDTEYQFVLQGSDTAGWLYRSDTMTFTTPEAADAPAGTNVATGATVAGVSSEFSETFAAEQAIDGDLGTAWATAGDATPPPRAATPARSRSRSTPTSDSASAGRAPRTRRSPRWRPPRPRR